RDLRVFWAMAVERVVGTETGVDPGDLDVYRRKGSASVPSDIVGTSASSPARCPHPIPTEGDADAWHRPEEGQEVVRRHLRRREPGDGQLPATLGPSRHPPR